MRARLKPKKLQQDNLDRMKAVQQSAEGIIAAHLSDTLTNLAPYGGVTAAYALIMLGYYALRQFLPAPKAKQDFKLWSALAIQDKVTKSHVATKIPHDYRFLADPRRIVLISRAAQDFLGKHFQKRRCENCSNVQGAYAMIVLAYNTLRRELDAVPAARVFDILAPYAMRDIDAARERLSKLH